MCVSSSCSCDCHVRPNVTRKPTSGRRRRAVSTRVKDWRGVSWKQLQKLLVMIVWRFVGSNLHCKCFNFFCDTRSAVLTMLRFVIASPPPSVHVAQISIALGTMLYLISRKICLTERKKCGLASLLFWFTEFEKDNYNACNVSYTCTT